MIKAAVTVSTKEVQEAFKKAVVSGQEIYEFVAGSSGPMIRAIKDNTPQKTGNLRASIGLIEKKKNKGIHTLRGTVIIGARNYGAYKNYGNVAHLIEFGTGERVMLKGLRAGNITQRTMSEYRGAWWQRPMKGKTTGKVEGRRFITRGFDSTKGAMIKSIEKQLDNKLNKIK